MDNYKIIVFSLGKSKLMESFIEYIKKTDINANIIYIDFMNLDFEELKEYHL